MTSIRNSARKAGLSANATMLNLCLGKVLKKLGHKQNQTYYISYMILNKAISVLRIDNKNIITCCRILFLLYIGLVIYASVRDAEAMKSETYETFTLTTNGKLLQAFSIRRNWEKLRYGKESEEKQKMKPFHGMRFYNLAIVILFHVSGMSAMGPVANIKFPETVFISLKRIN